MKYTKTYEIFRNIDVQSKSWRNLFREQCDNIYSFCKGSFFFTRIFAYINLSYRHTHVPKKYDKDIHCIIEGKLDAFKLGASQVTNDPVL